MYLTYADFQSRGGVLREPDFNRFEALARGHIDRLTHDRVKADTTVRDPVKSLTYELVLLLSDTDKARRSGMKSSSNGGRSAVYVSDFQFRAQIASLAATLLTGEVTADDVPLLYAGVS
jgi:hypothetical protein